MDVPKFMGKSNELCCYNQRALWKSPMNFTVIIRKLYGKNNELYMYLARTLYENFEEHCGIIQ